MNPSVALVEICSINVDARYQRPLNLLRVRKLGSAFDRGASKAVSLSKRADGSLWAYDGSHTLAIYREMGFTHVPAVIVPGTPEQEAAWFLLMNGAGTLKANPGQKQQAALFAGDRLAIEADKLLEAYGIEVATGGMSAGKTRSIDFIKVCLKADKTRLEDAMSMIQRLWSKEREAWSRTIMRGAWEVAGLKLVKKVEAGLLKQKVTPRRVLDVAQGMQMATGEPGGGMGHVKKAMLALAQVPA